MLPASLASCETLHPRARGNASARVGVRVLEGLSPLLRVSGGTPLFTIRCCSEQSSVPRFVPQPEGGGPGELRAHEEPSPPAPRGPGRREAHDDAHATDRPDADRVRRVRCRCRRAGGRQACPPRPSAAPGGVRDGRRYAGDAAAGPSRGEKFKRRLPTAACARRREQPSRLVGAPSRVPPCLRVPGRARESLGPALRAPIGRQWSGATSTRTSSSRMGRAPSDGTTDGGQRDYGSTPACSDDGGGTGWAGFRLISSFNSLPGLK